MPTIFEAQAENISGLDPLRFTRLLKLLLHLEAKSAGIVESAIDVALNINVPDGGEDGRIKWEAGPENTNFLPTRFVQFQCKATEMGPAKCAEELIGSDGNVKEMVDSALSNEGAYILFTTQSLNQQQKEACVEAIRKKLREKGKPYADTAIIDVYDASKIQGWINKFVPAITAVLNWSGRPLIDGLITWEEWEQFEENHEIEFIADPAREEVINTLRPLLVQEKNCSRIIGMSGLGKTRLALEICRGDETSQFLSTQTAYIDAGHGAMNLPGIAMDFVRHELEGLLVIDNCDLALHQQVKKIITQPNSKMSLLTMHLNPDTDTETETISLGMMEDSYIKNMLEPAYSEVVPDLDRIVAFAQGFPQMAVLLVKARLSQTADMGSITDDQLVSKMLWGDGDINHQFESILQGCALFDSFGLLEEVEIEAQFIAENILATDIDSLYPCIRWFEKRGVIDTSGRYAQVRPKPLAIRLAADWWRNTRSARQTELISTPMPGQLEKAFCNQISKLDFLPEVRNLTEELCGDQGPFGQAEVILSKRGSRLFRALVEVNPYSTSERLFTCLSSLSPEELRGIESNVRRNLVWATEMLCFHASVFPKSARCMLLLAKEESEDWANNATGQFTQLFKVFLSGTEAPPSLRLDLVDEALHSGDLSIKRVIVEGLKSAIETHGGSRTVGAEYQGSKKPLEEWRPKVWQEAFDYWDECIKRLVEIKKTEPELSQNSKNAIAFNIRGLMQYGRVDILDYAINEFIQEDGRLWPEALDSIKTTISYDTDKMPDEGIAKLHEWIDLLTPESLGERLKILVSIPPYEHEHDDDGQLVDVAAINAKSLASELAKNIETIIPHITELVNGEQRHTYLFGWNLVNEAKKWEPVLTESLTAIVNSEHPNPNLIYGILDRMSDLSPRDWENSVCHLADNPGLCSYYPGAIITGDVTDKHLNKVIELIASNKIDTSAATVFSYGRALDDVEIELVLNFTSQLAQVSSRAGWVSLSILAMYSHGSRERWNASADVLREMLVKLPLIKEFPRQSLDTYHWRQAVKLLLPISDAQFAILLTEQILNSCGDKMDYGDLQHYIKPAMREIFAIFGREVWPTVAKAIEKSEPVQEYRFIQLFTSENSHDRKGTSILSDVPDEVIDEWCKSHPESAPIFVANATEVLVEEGDAYQISQRARYLLDNFGDNKKVLGELSANMGSFGWSGSVVPYHQKEITALETLLDHDKPTVREWIESRISYLRKRIDIEKQNDAESAWGIGYD